MGGSPLQTPPTGPKRGLGVLLQWASTGLFCGHFTFVVAMLVCEKVNRIND